MSTLTLNPVTGKLDVVANSPADIGLKSNYTAASVPTSSNDSSEGYAIGSRWVDTSTEKEYVAVDVSVGAAIWKETTAGGGEANTASNTGVGGVGIFKQKAGVDLEFKSINAGSNKVMIADDVSNNEVDIDINSANIDHATIQNIGITSHNQIDAHVISEIAHSDYITLTNRSGATTQLGYAYHIDHTTDNSFVYSTTDRMSHVAVAVDAIANLSSGRVCIGGRVDVYFSGAVTRGQYAYFDSASPGQAKGIDAPPKYGNWGMVLESRTGPGLAKVLLQNYAIGSLIVSGSTFPTSPFAGEQFRLQLSNRDITYSYNGVAWQSTKVNADTAFYVDGTNGIDSPEKGFGTGTNAFKTIQYAIDQIPGTVGGNIIINISNETYAEQGIIFKSKAVTGNYSLTLQGTLPAASSSGTGSSATQLVMGAAGAGLTKATFTDSTKVWTTNAYQRMLLIITGGAGSGQERIIYSNTATTLKLVGGWDVLPNATSTYAIYDFMSGTVLDLIGSTDTSQNVFSVVEQKNVIFRYITIKDWPGNFAILAENYATLSVYSCRIEKTRADMGGEAGIQLQAFSILNEIDSTGIFNLSSPKNYAVMNKGIRYQQASGRNKNCWVYNCTTGIAITSLTQQNASAIAGSVGNGLCLEGNLEGIDCNSGIRADIGLSIITGGTLGLRLHEFSYFIFRSNNEVSNNLNHGISLDGYALILNAGSGQQINNNGGWGVTAGNLSYGKGVSGFSYTGNTLGTYTADATSIAT